MKLFIASDLHYEHGVSQVPIVPSDADFAIFAGDIDDSYKSIARVKQSLIIAKCPSIVINGNHSYYRTGNYMEEDDNIIRTAAKEHNLLMPEIPIHFLENECIEFESIRFIGAALWTDYNLYNTKEKSIGIAVRYMTDYNCIKNLGSKIDLAEQLLERHKGSVAFIEKMLDVPFDGKTVVITHHLPSPLSIDERYKNDSLNPAFSSNLNHILENGKVDL